jgi:hypothetical protein
MAVTFTPTVVSNPTGVQGTYAFTHDVAHEGMLADLTLYDAHSYVNQSANALPFGALVTIDGTSGYEVNAVKLAVGPTLNQGITIDSPTFEGLTAGNAPYVGAAGAFPGTNLAADGRVGYPAKRGVNILRRGVIWVYSTEAVAIGDPVRFWDTDYSGTVAGAFVGRFCKTASGTRTTLFTNGAQWLSKTSGAGLAKLEISMVAATFTADT